MMRLAAIALLLASCATAPPAVDSQADAWHNARLVEATVNGCGEPCPAAGRCVDDYGLCWTPCAWQHSDEAERTMLHRIALETDPTRAFLMQCNQPSSSAVEASR
jgi:hypothetical protein